MGFYEQQVVPRAVDVLLGNRALGELRTRALAGVSGEVLEIGFGSGPNLEYYPAEVTKVLAVDPATVGRKLARKRMARARVPVEFIGLDGESLPLPDASVDNAVSTWTLCTIPDVESALGEVRRVLRPDGRLYFLEHGLSDDPKVARRQQWLDPLQQRFAGGCHLNRRHDELIAAAGFELEPFTTFTMAGPRTMGFMYVGQARPLLPEVR